MTYPGVVLKLTMDWLGARRDGRAYATLGVSVALDPGLGIELPPMPPALPDALVAMLCPWRWGEMKILQLAALGTPTVKLDIVSPVVPVVPNDAELRALKARLEQQLHA